MTGAAYATFTARVAFRAVEVQMMMATLRQLWTDQDGMTTVEYALLLALLTIASIVAWSTLGYRKTVMLQMITDRMTR